VATTCAENLVQVAQRLQANTFIQLVTEVGLADSLSNGGPYTVFVPTDLAFSKVPKDVLNKLSGDHTLLMQVLKNHIIAGTHTSNEFKNDIEIPTWSYNAKKVRINFYRNKQIMTVLGSTVSSRDNIASNGVLYLIDDVIFPMPTQDVLQYCASQPNLTQLVYSFVRANLQNDVFGGPFTLFAPNEAAFDAMPFDFLNTQFLQLSTAQDLIQYHYVKGTYYSVGLQNGEHLKTVQGTDVTIHKNSHGVMVESAHVIKADIKVTNGVVHIIDKLLQPSHHVMDNSQGEAPIGR